MEVYSNEEIRSALEQGNMYLKVLAKITTPDGQHTAMRKGRQYKVLEEFDDVWLVETEPMSQKLPWIGETLVDKDSDIFEIVIRR